MSWRLLVSQLLFFFLFFFLLIRLPLRSTLSSSSAASDVYKRQCMYWKLEIPFYGTIFEVGVLIFEQLLLTSIFVNLVEQAKTRSELEVYERLLKEDRMTGINNRTAFEEQLQDIEDHAQDYDNAALIFMDVDGLKNTNDLYGHNAGDELIISAALCIKNVFATYGKCYRIGGDEFCVLIFDSIENMDELLKQKDQKIIKNNRKKKK